MTSVRTRSWVIMRETLSGCLADSMAGHPRCGARRAAWPAFLSGQAAPSDYGLVAAELGQEVRSWRAEAGDVVPAGCGLQAEGLVHGPQPEGESVARVDAIDIVGPDDGDGGRRAHDVGEGRRSGQAVQERVDEAERVPGCL